MFAVNVCDKLNFAAGFYKSSKRMMLHIFLSVLFKLYESIFILILCVINYTLMMDFS